MLVCLQAASATRQGPQPTPPVQVTTRQVIAKIYSTASLGHGKPWLLIPRILPNSTGGWCLTTAGSYLHSIPLCTVGLVLHTISVLSLKPMCSNSTVQQSWVALRLHPICCAGHVWWMLPCCIWHFRLASPPPSTHAHTPHTNASSHAESSFLCSTSSFMPQARQAGARCLVTGPLQMLVLETRLVVQSPQTLTLRWKLSWTPTWMSLLFPHPLQQQATLPPAWAKNQWTLPSHKH